MRQIVALCLVLMLAACSSSVRTDVTRFHTADAGVPRSFTIVPRGGQVGSLEFQSYAEQVAAALQRNGWAPVAPGAPVKADAVVFLAWSVGAPSTRVESSAAYMGGGWGPGPWYGGFYEPFPYYDTRSYTIWPKTLSVDILDNGAWQRGQTVKLFEGRATTERGGNDIGPVMPYLVSGLFSGFPGPSGQTVRVDVPVPERAPSPPRGDY